MTSVAFYAEHAIFGTILADPTQLEVLRTAGSEAGSRDA
jgi:hypothetical protein